MSGLVLKPFVLANLGWLWGFAGEFISHPFCGRLLTYWEWKYANGFNRREDGGIASGIRQKLIQPIHCSAAWLLGIVPRGSTDVC